LLCFFLPRVTVGTRQQRCSLPAPICRVGFDMDHTWQSVCLVFFGLCTTKGRNPVCVVCANLVFYF
jgi:hypothetical protein